MREHPDINQLKTPGEGIDGGIQRRRARCRRRGKRALPWRDPATFALHDAQLVLARSYGFDRWPNLKAYTDGFTAGRLCDAVERGDIATVHDMLAGGPKS